MDTHSAGVKDAKSKNGFETDIDVLTAEFKSWNETDGRGNHQLWSMLGRVYEFSAKVQTDTSARSALIHLVEQEPSVKKSNKWKAGRKKPQELILTLLLGLKEETKSTKSQWSGALRAADKANVEPKHAIFQKWLKDIGGIQAARKTLKKEKIEIDFESLLNELDTYSDQSQVSFEAPLPDDSDQSSLPDGVGLVIVRQLGEGMEVVPIGTIVGGKLLTDAIKKLISIRRKKMGL